MCWCVQGLCAERDFKVVHGGFTDGPIRHLAHIPGTRWVSEPAEVDECLYTRFLSFRPPSWFYSPCVCRLLKVLSVRLKKAKVQRWNRFMFYCLIPAAPPVESVSFKVQNHDFNSGCVRTRRTGGKQTLGTQERKHQEGELWLMFLCEYFLPLLFWKVSRYQWRVELHPAGVGRRRRR